MKKYTVVLLIPFLIACSSPDSTEETKSADTDTAAVETPIEEEDALAELVLKEDGSKWEVNPETQDGMVRIDSMIQAFSGDDYVALGTTVKSELSSIIDQCTMTGEDHNQYHIVLHACLKESKAMKRGEISTTANLERFVAAYYEHFELWDKAPE